MVNAMKRVLVFDSGVGGLSVLDAIAASGHALELDYVADNAWLPYGLKSDAALRARVPALLASLVEQWRPEAVVHMATVTAFTVPSRAWASCSTVSVENGSSRASSSRSRAGRSVISSKPDAPRAAQLHTWRARYAGSPDPASRSSSSERSIRSRE